jgi:hypothetical protein
MKEVLTGSVGVCLRPDGNGKLAEIDSTGAWIRKATLEALSNTYCTVAKL